MKFTELQQRSTEDLASLGSQLRRELWQARFANHTNQLKDTSKIRQLRRDIAQVHTLETQRKSATTIATGNQS